MARASPAIVVAFLVPVALLMPHAGAPASPPSKLDTKTGLAAFYSKRRAWHRTTSGERYNPQALTAAHKRLTFGTLVKVRNVGNGRVVTVMINDRLSKHSRQIIDVSRAAAKRLKFRSEGLTRVTLEVVDSDSFAK
jgi:rare lipoprotein A